MKTLLAALLIFVSVQAEAIIPFAFIPFQAPAVNDTTGLVGYYHMDEAGWYGTAGEVIDSSGNSNAGTSYQGYATTTANGYINRGGAFNGYNGVVSMPNSGSLSFTNAVSVAFWFKTTTTSAARFVSKGADGYAGWLTAINYTSGAFTFFATLSSNYLEVATTGTFNDGNWHHAVVSMSTTTLNIYIDGTLQPISIAGSDACVILVANSADIASCTASMATTWPMFIGAGSDLSNNFFEGLSGTIDEVSVWNFGLSSAQALAAP